MAESISWSAQLRPVIVLDPEQEEAIREVIELIESGDDMLVNLAQGLDIQFDYGLALTPEQRESLTKSCLASLGYAFDTASWGINEAKEPREEEIQMDQAMALGKQFDYDGSVLTPAQKEAVFKKFFAMALKEFGLRSPQYYEDKSQCLSIADNAWPGAVGYVKAEKLKQGYFEPEDLIERLRKLKPSDNFELRKFHHPRMDWRSPTPLEEECVEIWPSWPPWVMDQLYAVSAIEKSLGRQSATQYHQDLRDWAIQRREGIRNRWAEMGSGVELAPLPNLHLLRNMGRSPSGTLFPWYLVKGLVALRDYANIRGSKSYNEEYDSAIVKREEVIDRWRETNPKSILADDQMTWPSNLMDELDKIDRQAIRHGSRKYVALLRKAEEKMRMLVTFWRDCGLITGQRDPPLCWWQDPKVKAKRLCKPHYLKTRLKAINTELGYRPDMAEKLRMIETSRWIESTINTESDPIGTDTPLPQSLLDELDIVWQDRNRLDEDDTEDEMIARIRQWRKSKHLQKFKEEDCTCPQLDLVASPEEPVPGQTTFLRDSASDSGIAPGARPLLENLHCQSRIPTAENLAIWRDRLRPRTKTRFQSWRDRLRPRRDAVGEIEARSRKPQGMVKRRSPKRKRATNGHATTLMQTVESSQSGIQSHYDESASQIVPSNVTKDRRKSLRRPLRQAGSAQPHGIQKTRGNQKQMGAITTNRKQSLSAFLHHLDPSE